MVKGSGLSSYQKELHFLFHRKLFDNNVRLKIAQNLRIYPRLKKGEERLFWILYKIKDILCFSANVRQCNIAYSVLHVQLCF